MPTRTVETYDGRGNLIGTSTVTVSQEDVNRDATADALTADMTRVMAIRARALEIRDDWATMTANQRDRAMKDTADNQADLAKTLLHMLRMARADYATPPEP